MIGQSELIGSISALWVVGLSLVAYIMKLKDKREEATNKALSDIRETLTTITLNINELKSNLNHNIEDTREIGKDIRTLNEVMRKHSTTIANLNSARILQDKKLVALEKRVNSQDKLIRELGTKINTLQRKINPNFNE